MAHGCPNVAVQQVDSYVGYSGCPSDIAEKLGIDRDSMTANIDRRPRRKKVA